MEKNFFIVFLAGLVAGLLYVINLQSDRLESADKYIKELETDFPEYIDTTSGSDAYNNWYNN
jgi:hypothetical protein